MWNKEEGKRLWFYRCDLQKSGMTRYVENQIMDSYTYYYIVKAKRARRNEVSPTLLFDSFETPRLLKSDNEIKA